VLERYSSRLAAPKAHAVCPRSFEVFRQFSLDTKKIRGLGSQRDDAYWVNFVTNLSGKRIGRLEYERMDPAVLESTPEMIHNIPQPDLEQLLADELAKNGLVEIRKGHSFISVDQDSTSPYVRTVIEERLSQRQYQVISRFVIGCDGRKSRVRSALGVSSEGEDSVEAMMTIHFNANLRSVLKEHVGILHWIFDPEVSGFLIGYNLSGNFVLIHNFDPEARPVQTWTEEHCRNIVDKAIGQTLDYDILSFRPWILSRKIAQSYRVGNVFLAGDAAHSFPPNGGLGLNSGIADVHNLAYKVAAVLKGWGSESLLNSYEAERRPIAEINALQSVKNGKQIFGLLKALGTAGIENPQIARKNLYRTIQDPENSEEIQRQIEEQREHFDNLELHIGYVYGGIDRPANASNFSPKFVPGARLPHAWINPLETEFKHKLSALDVSYVSELSTQEIERRRYSTLDLCERDGFTMLVGCESTWKQKLDSMSATIATKSPPVYIKMLGMDFEMEETANAASWIDRTGISEGNSILVRPDQHILGFLSEDESLSDLERLLDTHTGGHIISNNDRSS
jgi:2-polyprenyl-6-methoxyphenol hydroxylase-like FAD-dependent oxidoreductase